MQVSKRVLLQKRNLTVIGVCLVVALLSSFITWAATPSLTYTISSGVAPGAPKYTIYQVDGINYGKDQNGYIEFQSANASYVITTAISYASSQGGGLVFVEDASYTLNNRLTMLSNVWLSGQSWKTILVAGTNLNDDVIRAASQENMRISNLQIDGNVESQSSGGGTTFLIDFQGCNNSIVENCYGHDAYSHGFGDYGTPVSQPSFDNIFRNNLLVNISWNSICIGSADYPSYRDQIIGNTIVNFGDLGVMLSSGRHCMVSNNRFIVNGSLVAVGSEGARNAFATEGNLGYYNHITNNVIDYSNANALTQDDKIFTFTAGYGDVAENNVIIANSYPQLGIYSIAPNCTISGGKIIGLNTGGYGCGIQLYHIGSVWANETVVRGVSFVNCSTGVDVQDTARTLVLGCDFNICTNNIANTTAINNKSCYDTDAGTWIADSDS